MEYHFNFALYENNIQNISLSLHQLFWLQYLLDFLMLFETTLMKLKTD